MLLFAVLLACSNPKPAAGSVVLVMDSMRADYGGSRWMPLRTDECRVYTQAHSAAPYTSTSSIVLQTGRLPVGAQRLPVEHAFGLWPEDAWAEAVVTDHPCLKRLRKEPAPDLCRHQSGSPDLIGDFVTGGWPTVPTLVHALGPHTPYHRNLDCAGQGYVQTTSQQDYDEIRRSREAMPDDLAAAMPIIYRDAVEASLWEVRRVMEARPDDALLIVTADHGEALGEDGMWGHNLGLHDPQIHVPLIVCGPGVLPGEDSTPVGPLCVAETVTGRGPCDLRTGEGLRAGEAGMLVDGEWVTRDVGADWSEQ